MTATANKVEAGDHIKIVTEDHREVEALVTIVHGSADGSMKGEDWIGPTINAVFVSPDTSKTDSYGRQVERYTSLQHQNATSANGRYWSK